MTKNHTIPPLNFAFYEPPKAEGRQCDYPNCKQPANYRAPKSRQSNNEFYWFCLEHVRQYNEAWDFYAGMTLEEIEQMRDADMTWGRPTWPLNAKNKQAQQTKQEEAVRHAWQHFQENVRSQKHQQQQQHSNTARQEFPLVYDALKVLGFRQNPIKFSLIKKQYIALAKQCHPDSRGGDTSAIEKLKVVNEAYALLRKHKSLFKE